MSTSAATTLTPPTMPGYFLVGSAPAFIRDTLDVLIASRQLGDLVRMYFGPFPLYIVNSPELAHEVLVTKAASFYKSSNLKRVLDKAVGKGLFTNDGESWRQQRKLAQPAFHTRRIASYADVMVRYADELASRWHDGEHIDVERDMAAVTMKIIAKTVFDADVEGETDGISQAVTYILRASDKRFNNLVQLPDWLPTPGNRRMQEAVDFLDREIQRFIDERRASGEDKGDLLSMLMAAQDEENGQSMSDKQLRDEAMTVFGAGHETTAVTLTWALYALSQAPHVEAQLHAELDTVLAGRLPTYEDLPKLPYTEKVIKEVMRLYPAAWGVTRESIEPVSIGGYPVKPATLFMVNIYGIHRDARYWAQPETFDPERFSPENEKNIPRYAYFPFGAGPRVCIGNAFAMMEARLLLATLAQRYRFALAPVQTVKPARMFTLRPQNGLHMVALQRQTMPAAQV